MKTINLRQLSSTECFDVSSLFVMKQRWREGQKFTMESPRRQSALLWLCGASATFLRQGHDPLNAERGALICIPEGCTYTIEFSNCDADPSTVLIEFCLDDGEPFSIVKKITVIEQCLDDPDIINTILKLATEYAMPQKPWLDIKSRFYKLLSLLARRDATRHIGAKGFSTIEKGIIYLQTNEEQSLSLDEVAAMCYVTPAYFRRLFRAYSGISPSQYRLNRKIERARELLASSHLSVAEISALLGFESPSYFCVAFKKAVGVPPTSYRSGSIEK